MPVEIERKFLVRSDAWKSAVTRVEHLHDGLVARFGEGKVRVRRAQGRAWIAIKGPRRGLTRPEYEYEIPLEDADEILRTMCQGPVIEKLRHCVLHDGRTWSVDVHTGRLAHVVLAEVELSYETERLDIPAWVGREVTHDPAYKKEALARQLGGAGEGPGLSG